VTRGGEPPDRAAEQALRHAICWRKASYGTDSAGRGRFVERLLTVVATCRQQSRGVLDCVSVTHTVCGFATVQSLGMGRLVVRHAFPSLPQRVSGWLVRASATFPLIGFSTAGM
jgi:hypothetical protein